MNRALRFMPLVVVAAAAFAFGASGASGGNGSTVLQGTFHTVITFDINGSPTGVVATCNESRVQKPDGSASESMTCRLDAGEPVPDKAAKLLFDSNFGWQSDFVGTLEFAGASIATDGHGVLTPSGVANLTFTYAAP